MRGKTEKDINQAKKLMIAKEEKKQTISIMKDKETWKIEINTPELIRKKYTEKNHRWEVILMGEFKEVKPILRET